MDLPDRRCREWFLVERGICLGRRLPQLGLDPRSDGGERHRGHVVLELLQLRDESRRDEVAAGRKELPGLDERRAESFECSSHARLDRLLLGSTRAPGVLGPDDQPIESAGSQQLIETLVPEDARDLLIAGRPLTRSDGWGVDRRFALRHAGSMRCLKVRGQCAFASR